MYDFSKTKTNIAVAESGKAIAEKNIDLVKQRFTSITITSYYMLVYLLEAVKNEPPRRKRTGYPGIFLIAASSGEFTLRD